MDQLKKLRNEVDAIDDELIALVEARIGVVKKIRDIKKRNNFNIKDNEREEALLQELIKRGESKGIDKRIIIKIWKALFELSYQIERGK